MGERRACDWATGRPVASTLPRPRRRPGCRDCARYCGGIPPDALAESSSRSTRREVERHGTRWHAYGIDAGHGGHIRPPSPRRRRGLHVELPERRFRTHGIDETFLTTEEVPSPAGQPPRCNLLIRRARFRRSASAQWRVRSATSTRGSTARVRCTRAPAHLPAPAVRAPAARRAPACSSWTMSQHPDLLSKTRALPSTLSTSPGRRSGSSECGCILLADRGLECRHDGLT